MTDHEFSLYDCHVAVKPLRERQAEATRGLLIDEARELFTDQGYGATSIEDIIRQDKNVVLLFKEHPTDAELATIQNCLS